ncbi:Hypothetical protein NTJ_14049 [Nesidiocoris tenuis]|uniref:Uncharacterized protein n=1 Tax=Nesidiocoris tenuis TaxID=355587 RepID=A0ABN7BA17_9HEMI|nr:Hypothetical protein NTJ_14049 [Nesidiocoris tenuis]
MIVLLTTKIQVGPDQNSLVIFSVIEKNKQHCQKKIFGGDAGLPPRGNLYPTALPESSCLFENLKRFILFALAKSTVPYKCHYANFQLRTEKEAVLNLSVAAKII